MWRILNENYHLRKGEVFKTYRSERDFDYAKALLDKVAKGIENEDFAPFYGFYCNFLDSQSVREKYFYPHYGGPRIDLKGRIVCAEKFNAWNINSEIPGWIEEQSEKK